MFHHERNAPLSSTKLGGYPATLSLQRALVMRHCHGNCHQGADWRWRCRSIIASPVWSYLLIVACVERLAGPPPPGGQALLFHEPIKKIGDSDRLNKDGFLLHLFFITSHHGAIHHLMVRRHLQTDLPILTTAVSTN